MRALGLETYRLTKRFGDFTALDQVSIRIARGAVPFLVPWRRRRAELAAFMQRMPFKLDMDAPVGSLAAGERQKLEILKQLYADNRFLILDEPTSVLTPEEADEVLAALRDLAHAATRPVRMFP